MPASAVARRMPSSDGSTGWLLGASGETDDDIAWIRARFDDMAINGMAIKCPGSEPGHFANIAEFGAEVDLLLRGRRILGRWGRVLGGRRGVRLGRWRLIQPLDLG